MAPWLCGTSTSSLFEALLGKEMGKEVHIHTPAYQEKELQMVFQCCDHVVFNSLSQWNRFSNMSALYPSTSIGLRINPEYSEIKEIQYNTCLPSSRFGATRSMLEKVNISDIDGFHLHVMYDQGAETLARVIDVVIEKFDDLLMGRSWLNLGGGHRLADIDYNIEILRPTLKKLTEYYGLTVYVEPCEPIVAESGFLVSTILDIVGDGEKTAILDTSAICHMPDVLDTPYRPDILQETDSPKSFPYILAGISCLAGDIIGKYMFNNPLRVGEKIVFTEMGAYTFARENHFNGINYPSIALYDKENGLKIVKQFSYADYCYKYL